MSDQPYRFCKKIPPPPGWHKTAFNYAIARWLTQCRALHNEICPCGHFRDHWFQEDLTTSRSVATQTECLLPPEPPLRQPKEHTPAPAATGTTKDKAGRRAGRYDPLDFIFGPRPGTARENVPNRAPKPGSCNEKKKEKRKNVASGWSATKYCRLQKTPKQTVINRSGTEPWPDSDDITDEDILTVHGTDGEVITTEDDTGTPPDTD
ncbi:VP2 [Gyrovirus 11]|uniref:Dual specificity protein phosphatase VP2 n=1 Tax=Gyrovirus 11 TaxID=2547963 RepID=A0A482D3C0_9VIRU|nr:VP2 [Gyrovirus 11]QBM01054.1 VP2 [Gyrovirus 11]